MKESSYTYLKNIKSYSKEELLREIDSLAHDIKVGQESVLERINRIDKLMRRMQTEKAINVALRRCIRKYENREDIMKILAYDAEYKAKKKLWKAGKCERPAHNIREYIKGEDPEIAGKYDEKFMRTMLMKKNKKLYTVEEINRLLENSLKKEIAKKVRGLERANKKTLREIVEFLVLALDEYEGDGYIASMYLGIAAARVTTKAKKDTTFGDMNNSEKELQEEYRKLLSDYDTLCREIQEMEEKVYK